MPKEVNRNIGLGRAMDPRELNELFMTEWMSSGLWQSHWKVPCFQRSELCLVSRGQAREFPHWVGKGHIRCRAGGLPSMCEA